MCLDGMGMKEKAVGSFPVAVPLGEYSSRDVVLWMPGNQNTPNPTAMRGEERREENRRERMKKRDDEEK